ncbi:unnamed protein product [Rhizopus microsporus]
MHPSNITSSSFYQLVQRLTSKQYNSKANEKSTFAETYVSFPDFTTLEKKKTLSTMMKPEVMTVEATPCFC